MQENPIQNTPTPTPTPTPEQSFQTPPPTPPVTPSPAGSGLAIASLAVGIFALLSCWLLLWGVVAGIAALVLGILSLKKKPEGKTKKFAVAGIVNGGVATLFGIVITILLMVGFTLSTQGLGHSTSTNSMGFDASDQAMLDAQKDFPRGSTANFGIYEVKVNSIQRNYTLSDPSKMKDGYEYIVVNMTMKNIDKQSEFSGAYLFSVDDGTQKYGGNNNAPEPAIANGELQPGQSITGNIVFAIPENTQSLKLSFDHDIYASSGRSKTLTYTLAL